MMASLDRMALRRVLRDPLVLFGNAALLSALVALATCATFLWLPAQHRHSVADARSGALIAELRELRVRREMVELYRARNDEVETLEGKLHLARSEPDFVAEVEKLATASAAELLQFSSRTSAREKSSTETTLFEFFLKGDYGALKLFIAGVRELPELVTVERVVLERIEPSVSARVLLKRHTARRT